MADQFAVDTKGVTMVSAKVYDMLVRLESTRRDCFPSLHTAITVIVTTFAYKYRRWMFWFFLPVNIGIIMATIYLRYHYVIDVFAGLALAAFCVWAGPRLNDLWYRRVTGDHVMDDYPRNLDLPAWWKSFLARLRRAFSGREITRRSRNPE
jgi:membrane-associated phospholipid phosphatase